MKTDPVLPQQFAVPHLVQFYLSRGRLIELMNHATENKLTLVSAPPGYGKTSLLIDYAGRTNYPVCWYGLESNDNKLIKFVEGFACSIQQKFPKFGRVVNATISSGSTQNMDPKTLSAIFINDLNSSIDEHFLVFLDDFQWVDTNSEISEFVNNILIDSDENLHIVISSRALLGLPDLPLLVARSQVGGLSYEELSFTKQEIKELILLIQKRSISDADAEIILRNCEGWVMGLLLSSQLENGPLSKVFPRQTSREIGINNFLALQVLNELPMPVQMFLLRSSLFDHFDFSSFSKVMKDAGIENLEWQKSFNYIVEHNLFIVPSGDKHAYYRYHNLFQEFLRGNMNQKFPEEAKKIQLSLASYYQENEEWGKAFNLFNGLGEVDRNVSLIENAAPGLIAKGRINEVEEWLVSIPKNKTEQSSALLSTWGAISSIRGDYKQSIEYFNEALKRVEIEKKDNLVLLTLSRRAGTYRFTGDYQKSLDDSNQIIEIARSQKKYTKFIADANFLKGTCHSFTSEWELAQQEIEMAQQLYTEIGDKDAAAKCWLQHGFIQKSIGHYQQAFTYYKKALGYYLDTRNIIWEASVLNNMGILAQLQCDFRQSFDYFEKAFEYAGVTRNKRSESYLLASIGDLYADLGIDYEALDAYDQALFRLRKETDHYLSPYLHIAMAKVEHSEEERSRLLAKARQELTIVPNQNLQNNLEIEDLCQKINQNKTAESSQRLLAILELFSDHNQIVDMLCTLARICVLATRQPGLIDLNPLSTRIQSNLLNPDYSRYLILLLQRYGMPHGEIINLPVDASTKQKVRMDWDLIIDNRAKARLHIRRRGSVVPLRPAKILIRSFGKTIISRAEKTITISDWKTQVARDLFIFLAVSHQSYTKEEIGEIFWPESTIDDLKLRFKNTVYRLRSAIGKDVILFEDERYEINQNIDIDFDYESFLEEVNSYSDQNDDCLKSDLQAIKLYRGSFLHDVDMPWSNQIREELGQRYFSCLLDAASRYIELEDYESGLRFALKASEYDPLSETAYQLAMRSLGAMGDRSGVIRHYQKLVKNLSEELAIEPSTATVNLFNLLIR